ncbi:MAG: Hsp20/alpha crystallin family protein [Bdellovibrionaceae bacterium]|nr:Hsp20/alpha crystallin family protein [Pseudobdellovibrionaceae bacterium]NUM58698.1 Hsp20/alpha crystallin family protein [Pseudobdellovibrionaceae bacterium]
MRRSLFSPSNNLPYTSTWNLMKEFDEIFNDFANASPAITGEFQTHYQPHSEVKETDAGYLMSFDIPGVKESDIKVEFNDRVLKVHGERKSESKVEKEGFFRTEKTYGRFERAFRLPENVDENKIEASYSDGVLQVYLPKEASKATKTISVATGSKNLFEKLLGKKEESH